MIAESVKDFKHQCIKVATCALALVCMIVPGVIGSYAISVSETEYSNDLKTRAQLLSYSSREAMMQEDSFQGASLLKVIGSDHRVSMGCLMNSEGKVIAEYRREPSSRLCNLLPVSQSITTQEFSVSVAITNGSMEDIGRLILYADKYRILAFSGSIWLYGLVLMIGILGVMYFLMKVFYNRLFRPLENLERAMERIQEQGVYKGLSSSITGPFVLSITRAMQVVSGKISQLEEAKAEALASSERKSAFIASLAHELRTPLNSIVLVGEDIASLGATYSKEHLLRLNHMIVHSARNLMVLINDLLDIARAEAGKLHVQCQEASLLELISSLEAQFIPVARERKLKFSIHKDPDVADFMFTDIHRLEQVLRNLLSNAFKFTSRGEVRLHFHTAALELFPDRKFMAEAGQQLIGMTVHDTGIGIANGQKDRVFEAYHQEPGSVMYGSMQGIGLGLTISKQLAQLLDAVFQVESNALGSSFTLLMPRFRSVWERTRLATKENQYTAYASSHNSEQKHNGAVV